MGTWMQDYDRLWRAREKIFDDILENERSLARAIARFDTFERNHQLKTNGSDVRYFPHQSPPDPYSDIYPNTPMILHGQTVTASAYIDFRQDRYLADLSWSADCVIELGSGYGRQIFATWLAGSNPRARYIAAEPSESGRRLGQRLAALEPALSFSSQPFDFSAPSLPDLAPTESVLLFTSWAVMYANPFDPALLRSIAAHPGAVTCVFVEPIGFQIDPAGPQAERQRAQFIGQNMNLDFYQTLLNVGGEVGLEVACVMPNLFGSSEETLQLASVIVATKS